MDHVSAALERYRNSRVMVLYSAGFDSSVIAHALKTRFDAEVTLLICDTGTIESGPADSMEYDRQQFVRYRHLLGLAAGSEYPTIETRLPNYTEMTVDAHNLKPSKLSASAAEEERGAMTFYSGFIMMRLAHALSLAAARGIEHVVTGHMLWNTNFYRDETFAFAQQMNDLFDWTYGDRLRTVPHVSMPLIEHQIDKNMLVKYNAGLPNPLDPVNTFSCGAAEKHMVADVAVGLELAGGRYQVHCGLCAHCVDRKAVFAAVGIKDTAHYAR